MSLESNVDSLTQATSDLLKAVTFQKSYLDAAAKAAIEGVTVQGAIVPTPGKSPVGDNRGKFSAAWLDTEIPIATTYPVAVGMTNKAGYSYIGQSPATGLWYRIATFAVDGGSNAQHLRIDGVLNDNWAANAGSPFVLLLGVRGGFYYDATFNGVVPVNARIVVFLQANGTSEVYLHFRPGTFGSASFNLLGYTTITYAPPVSVTSLPAGTIVYDTGDAVKYPPRSRGNPTAPVGTLFNELLSVGNGTISTSFLAAGAAQNSLLPGGERELLRLGVGGIDSLAHAGFFTFRASAANGQLTKEGYKLALRAYDAGSSTFSSELMRVDGDGKFFVPLLKAGSSDTSTLRHNISRSIAANTDAEILYIGKNGASAPCVGVNTSNGAGGWAASPAVLYVGRHGATNRSINVPGTVNTGGNDYAEYIFKSPLCGNVSPGQIVGITADNKISDKWADAVMFSIKSTAPSFVGGDTWASDVGARPSPQAGPAPSQPVRREDVLTQQAVPGTHPLEYEDVVTEPGDTDDEWAEKQATYTATLAAHSAAELQDAEAMAAFNAALEVERKKVDRIAIAGRVPVNVQGAQPGDYIVPAQDGVGIKGVAVHEDDLSMKQYFRAVGRVISIESDGRAYVMVKVV